MMRLKRGEGSSRVKSASCNLKPSSSQTRAHSFQGSELAPANLETWQPLRAGLETRRHTRVLRQRFRRDPEVYLRQLEALLLKRTLPP